MLKLQGKDLYLAVLEQEDCRTIWREYEYDEEHPYEPFQIGYSKEKADEWFLEIQQEQFLKSLRLGIFLNENRVIGDIALQDINYFHRSCYVGCAIAKIKDRGKGYGTQALSLLLDYGFRYAGMERIAAITLEHNIIARKSLEDCGFVLEGRERRAVYQNGRRYDRINYGILKEECISNHKE